MISNWLKKIKCNLTKYRFGPLFTAMIAERPLKVEAKSW